MTKKEVDEVRAALMKGVEDGLCSYDPETDRFSITPKGEEYLKRKVAEVTRQT
jgi:DNA-binding PadR family transcriptional regulator